MEEKENRGSCLDLMVDDIVSDVMGVERHRHWSSWSTILATETLPTIAAVEK